MDLLQDVTPPHSSNPGGHFIFSFLSYAPSKQIHAPFHVFDLPLNSRSQISLLGHDLLTFTPPRQWLPVSMAQNKIKQ